MLKRIASITLLWPLVLHAFPVWDAAHMDKAIEFAKAARDQFNHVLTLYNDKLRVGIVGYGGLVDTIDNGVANMNSRINSMLANVQNNELKKQIQPLDDCNSYATSTALNDLTCQVLGGDAKLGNAFAKNVFDPDVGIKRVLSSKHPDINDTSWISQVQVKKPLPDAPLIDQYNALRKAAFFGTSHYTLSHLKQKQTNMVNVMGNVAIDNFAAKATEAREKLNPSQLLRAMAVSMARQTFVMMMHYKDQISREQVLAEQLTLETKQTFGA